mgnify:FL=1
MFITHILFNANCVLNKMCVYLHHRNVTKIRNFEMIRNSTFILKLKRYDYERIQFFKRWQIQ